jgi:hypothetical protein
MSKLLGCILIGTGFIGLVFFMNYKGTQIPVKGLWFILSFFFLCAGVYLNIKQRLKQNFVSENAPGLYISELLATGENVRLTLENAEVKTRPYVEQIEQRGLPGKIEMSDAIYDDNRNYTTKEVQQTYIVYERQQDGKNYKFISQPIRQDPVSLKLYMDRRGVDLYIDKSDPAIYYFDIPFI